MPSDFRVGFGIDFHKFKDNLLTDTLMARLGLKNLQNFVPLGGVLVPFERGIEAHSDGDVLLHALVDAILGAIGKGDIGMHFSDTDPRWKGVSSDNFVTYAISLLKESGFKLSNIDAVIICEAPRLKNHREAIRQKVADLCEVSIDIVNIKGKTTEKMGFLGRGEGIAAMVNLGVVAI
jgi:2-C-methyl-D-erythritol 4-phosphate cytidylyltransferase/2-C-methyl-D-erythritol 2,4-cyclodiphosphate synthase